MRQCLFPGASRSLQLQSWLCCSFGNHARDKDVALAANSSRLPLWCQTLQVLLARAGRAHHCVKEPAVNRAPA
ncbi:hypothetical protein ABBQ38_001270 [Trebouxia sp. C0009 RCD-2024]